MFFNPFYFKPFFSDTSTFDKRFPTFVQEENCNSEKASDLDNSDLWPTRKFYHIMLPILCSRDASSCPFQSRYISSSLGQSQKSSATSGLPESRQFPNSQKARGWYPQKREKLLSTFISQTSQRWVHWITQSLALHFPVKKIASGGFLEQFCSFIWFLKVSSLRKFNPRPWNSLYFLVMIRVNSWSILLTLLTVLSCFSQPPTPLFFSPDSTWLTLSGYCLTCQLTLPQSPAVLHFHGMHGSLH